MDTLIDDSGGDRFDECRLVFSLLHADVRPGVMVDVGAHIGAASIPFALAGWRVWAFEPDRQNRNRLYHRRRDAGVRRRVRISPLAVSDERRRSMPFFTSEVSTGISGFVPFHESHIAAGTVATTTLDHFIRARHVRAIDFLKIDVEGHELAVLHGLDFARLRPRAILAEFEDRKTRTIGYGAHDLARLLSGLGYSLLVSEWHPIKRYGGPHHWRRISHYPCEIPTDSWGNLVALDYDPVAADVNSAIVFAKQPHAPRPRRPLWVRVCSRIRSASAS